MNRFIPYGRQWVDDDDVNAVAKALRSGWITQGPAIRDFEAALCAYTGARYAVAVSSGTAALHIACLAAGIGKGDRAITSPITFLASANSVLYCGGVPIFADVQTDTINIDPREFGSRVGATTKAVIPVHFAGHPCDMKEISAIARKRGLTVIEDAAHALGASYRGRKTGACDHSDMAIFSFHPVKSITTGEGGAVMTNRRDLYEKLLVFRNHGIVRDEARFTRRSARSDGSWYYEMQCLGFNYRITDIQCALGMSQLKKLDRFLALRREMADQYHRAFSTTEEIILPVEREYVSSAWHIYCVQLKAAKDRTRVFEGLHRAGIGVQVHYIPVYLQPYYRDKGGYRPGLCPHAEWYYRRAITLPLYPDMTPGQLKKVVCEVKRLCVKKR